MGAAVLIRLPMTVSSSRVLLPLAWTNAVLHGAGLLAAWLALRHGSVLVPLAERMVYLATAPSSWRWGWAIWMLCSLLLAAFMGVLRRRVPEDPLAAQLAVLFTVAGMAVDLLCDVIQIEVLPAAAASGPAVFLAFERLAFTGGLTVANGLYTLGVLLMNSVLPKRGKATRLVGWATVLSGFALAAAGVFPAAALLQGATGATIGCFSLWAVLAARDLRIEST